MHALKAWVENGRLKLDEPTDLPDGKQVAVVVVEDDGLSDSEREQLLKMIDESCDPLGPGAVLPKPCTHDPAFTSCRATQRELCRKTCLPYVPNVCDCFGCCEVQAGTTRTAYLVPGCTAADLGDPARCPPCTIQTSCFNPCGRCEVCVGRPQPEAGCTPPHDGGVDAPSDDGCAADAGGTEEGRCPEGLPACGAGGVDPWRCPRSGYDPTACITGCCVPLPPQCPPGHPPCGPHFLEPSQCPATLSCKDGCCIIWDP